MQSWNLLALEMPDGSRDPIVLRSEDEARVVLIALLPGQELRDHQVKENAYLVVVEGEVVVGAGGEQVAGGVGALFRFEENERHAVSSPTGARILLFLAPWPGPGHYRGGR